MRGSALAASPDFFPHPVMASAQATEMTTGRNFFLILVRVIRSRISLHLVLRHRMRSARAFAKNAFPAARGESPSRRSLYAEFRWQAKQMFKNKASARLSASYMAGSSYAINWPWFTGALKSTSSLSILPEIYLLFPFPQLRDCGMTL